MSDNKVQITPNQDGDTKTLVVNNDGNRETEVITINNKELPIIYRCDQVTEEQKARNNLWNMKIKAAIACFVIGIPVITLIVITAQKDNSNKAHLSKNIGAALWSMYIIYFSIIFYFVFSGSNFCRKQKTKSLYRIYSHSGIINEWANLSISGYQELHLNQAITSISEMSAIDGAIPNLMLAYLGAITWTSVVVNFGAILYYEDGFEWDLSDIFEIIGCTGLVIIGLFELDPFNVWMGRIHDFGALLGCGTLVGYILQCHSIEHTTINGYIPTITGVIGFVWWTYSKRQTAKFTEQHKYIERDEVEKIADQITKFSITNVISEALFLFSGATAMCFWLMSYSNKCDMGCMSG